MSRIEKAFELLAQESKYRKEQLFSALFRSSCQRYSEITTLSQALRQKIADALGDEMVALKVANEMETSQTKKWLFELADGNRIEAVRMQFQSGLVTLCISSQVGCFCKCSFCMTGKVGFKRQLTADEIVDQVLFCLKSSLPIENIVFMGMGEPLYNPNVFEALRILTSQEYMRIGSRRITVSTVGVPHEIVRLTEEFPQVNLTFSLHNPFNEERNELVPLNKKYPIESVMDVLEERIVKTKRRLTIAYLVLTGKNDTMRHAKRLKELLCRKGLSSFYHVNLLRYNEASFPEAAGFYTSEASLQSIKSYLEAERIPVTIRHSFGQEIQAACGQLAADYISNESAL